MRVAISGFGKAAALTAWMVSAALLAQPASADFYCDSLSAQLAALPRANAPDPNRTNAIVQELNQAQWQARRFNCRLRFLGPPPHPYCPQINGQIAQLKAQLRGSLGGGSSWGSRMERQRILNAMASNRCQMPQTGTGTGMGVGGGYRTLCVRTCDGYYFPISFSAGRSRFKIDETACKSMYPEGAASLFIHRSIGEESDRAVSLKGERYADQPFAFAYNKEFTPACKGLLTEGLATLRLRFETAKAEKLAADAKAGKTGRRDRKGRLILPPPVPMARPAPGEDPETLANRAGDFVIESQAPPVAMVDLNEEKPVRIVGGFFYSLPTEEETARMNKLRLPPRPIATDNAPVAADMVPDPTGAIRGALTGGDAAKVGLP